jgi:hypothetical protein
MLINVLALAVCFATPPLLSALMRAAVRLPPPPDPGFFRQWAAGGFGGAAFSGLAAPYTGWWPGPAAYGASGLLGLVLWWHSRRKRKRSLKALGNKARARLAALARNMPRPSPARRPVPQGA